MGDTLRAGARKPSHCGHPGVAVDSPKADIARRPPTGGPDLAAKAIVPTYALSSHVAPLGLTMFMGTALPEAYRDGPFVSEHGSWDRTPLNGYKVVFVPFSGGKPSGPAEDVVTGFLDTRDHARGRPVGLAVDRSGALLIADDVGNTVWRVSADRSTAARK
jgi:glucose/arabinose dehydrogenase